MIYPYIYAHSWASSSGNWRFEAVDDNDAMRQADAFVAAGYQDSTWLRMRLTSGDDYCVCNKSGKPVPVPNVIYEERRRLFLKVVSNDA